MEEDGSMDGLSRHYDAEGRDRALHVYGDTRGIRQALELCSGLAAEQRIFPDIWDIRANNGGFC